MKRLILTAILVLSGLLSAFSQIKEGHVKYDVTIKMDEADDQAKMMSSMMEGSTLDIYFQDQRSRSEIQMGTMMNMTVVVDAKSGDILTLMSGMMGKRAIQSNLNDPEYRDAEEAKNYQIELLNETKVILGYTCKKANLKTEEGDILIAWYTEDVALYKKGLNYMNEEIPGIALEFEMDMNGLTMHVEAKVFEKTLKSKDLFDLSIPADYQVITREEIENMGRRR